MNKIEKAQNKHPLRLITAFKHSFDGIKAIWAKEIAFRQEVYSSLILLPLLCFLPIEPLFKLSLILLLLLLYTVETINSALETIVDRISLEFHEMSRNAKDMGSAAVCIVIFMNIIAWVYAIYSAFTAS